MSLRISSNLAKARVQFYKIFLNLGFIVKGELLIMAAHLFEPFRIKNLGLKNRFMRSATWDATAAENGSVTENSLKIYKNLGQGGIGLIVTGFHYVSAHGQALPGQYGIHSDEMLPGLRELAGVAHDGGAKIVVQIVHAGTGSAYLPGKGISMLAVSAKPDLNAKHREMTGKDISSIIDDFVVAACRVKEAGFDGVQLHGAHGYLMSQFLSPFYNRRTDQWGGTPENRRRFHLEVIKRIRSSISPSFPLMIKFGVMDDLEGGLSLAEGLETAKQMIAAGIDHIEVSSGFGGQGMTAQRIPAEQVYYRERAAAVKRAITAPVAMVAGIRSLEMAQEIITNGDADMISMSRPFIREPNLINRWQSGDTTKALCISCNQCFIPLGKGLPLVCLQEKRLQEKEEQSTLEDNTKY
jgi:2,4-dienoyl-CoA reductase-like NADH-dependent reductase (Old Yellow Enzyme family)